MEINTFINKNRNLSVSCRPERSHSVYNELVGAATVCFLNDAETRLNRAAALFIFIFNFLFIILCSGQAAGVTSCHQEELQHNSANQQPNTPTSLKSRRSACFRGSSLMCVCVFRCVCSRLDQWKRRRVLWWMISVPPDWSDMKTSLLSCRTVSPQTELQESWRWTSETFAPSAASLCVFTQLRYLWDKWLPQTSDLR